jgi:hypothetical protein
MGSQDESLSAIGNAEGALMGGLMYVGALAVAGVVSEKWCLIELFQYYSS